MSSAATDYALAIARTLQGDRLDLAGYEEWPEPWRRLADAAGQAPKTGVSPALAVEQAIDQLDGQAQPVREQLYAAAARLLAIPEPETEEVLDCPPLPKTARLDPDLGADAGRWVDIYADYAQARSPMTPRMFHVSAALWLGAVAIARRLKAAMAFGDVYPNLFVLWLATTTLFRKSTALDIARDLAWREFPHLMAAQDTTPEAFLSDMAGIEPSNIGDFSERDRAEWMASRNFAAQKGWLLDEMSGLLAGAGKDYNAGLTESLLRCYDCSPFFKRSTRGQGQIVIKHSFLSLLGASTPLAMSSHLTAERLWSMGWWPRFAILTPEIARPRWKEPWEQEEPAELAKGLRDLGDRLPPATWPNLPEARAVSLGAGVHDAWAKYNKALGHDLLTDTLDERLYGTYGRLPAQGLKVAQILAAMDWQTGKAPTIELRHLARAMIICEEWRASAHRAISLATTTKANSLQQRLLTLIGRTDPPGSTLRDLCKAMRDVEPQEIDGTLQKLMRLGLVKGIDWQNPNGGPKTKRYQAT